VGIHHCSFNQGLVSFFSVSGESFHPKSSRRDPLRRSGPLIIARSTAAALQWCTTGRGNQKRFVLAPQLRGAARTREARPAQRPPVTCRLVWKVPVQFAKRREGSAYFTCCSSRKHGLPDLGSASVTRTYSRNIELFFLNLVNEFYTRKCDRRVIEVPKAQHRLHSLFDSAVVLFHQIVYIFTRSHGDVSDLLISEGRSAIVSL
jgi:hypothetical protein